MPKADLRIDWATHEASLYAVKHWHYSGSLPYGKVVKIGAWERTQFVGVVLFSYGANRNIGNPYGLEQVQCCELVRVALSQHTVQVSRIVAIALRFLKKANPGLRLVVSYADTGQGHHGGIYQAGGWVYTGISADAQKYVINEKVVHAKTVHTMIKDGKLESVKGLQKAQATMKHKYLMPLDDQTRMFIAPLAKAYPKRARSIVVDATGDQPVEGGSIPTRALHAPLQEA